MTSPAELADRVEGPTRRHFLGMIAAFSAAAVVPGTTKTLPKTDRDRLEARLAGGHVTIRDQEFVFYDAQPLALVGVRNVVFERCKFRWLGKRPPVMLYVSGSGSILIDDCVFTRADSPVHIGRLA